ncbi:MAG: BMP family ABC transporter substrate-binding protein [Oscillospiraceae bacterium]|nr:BMP family ABC transporter substrate-binding protein [Oscillospiraceae bacterium]
MKKLTALLLALVMVFALAACGSKNEPAPAADGSAAAEPAEAASDLKVGFIFLHDENSTYDKNFMDAAKAACEKLGVAYELRTNIPEGEQCYETAADLADNGCSLIFADSFGHEDFMIQAAKEYPEVQFCHATGTKAHTEKLDNYHNAFASIYEGRFLAGIAAGMKLNEMIENGDITADQAKMGYVGAFPYAEVKSGYTSFYLGAKSVCPSVTMEVTFTNSWYDQTLENEGANKLIKNGCVLLSQHADSMGAPSECEKNGIPFVFYNGSAADACPNTYIVASRINWAPYFELIINAVANGEEIPADWTGTIATGSVELVGLNETAAAPGTAEAIEAAKAKLLAGEIKVFDTAAFTKDGAVLETYLADVDTDPAYTPDTEVVADGYFHESEFRSAPYFEYIINCVQNGEAIDTDWTGTIATGSVELTEVNEAVAAEGTQAAIDEAIAKIEAGELHVFDTKTFTVDGKELTSYLADVDDMGDFQGETEVVADGYFHESEFRSAPYFDLDIDGIVNVDA